MLAVGQRLETGAEALDRLVHDHVQAVLLGLEVVVEGGRADAHVGGDVRPARVLIAVAAEPVRRRRQDLLPLGAAGLRRAHRGLTTRASSGGALEDRADDLALDHLQRRRPRELVEDLDRLGPRVLGHALALEVLLQIGQRRRLLARA